MGEEKLIDLYTEEGESLPEIPWNIYPRPKLVRNSFFCLNGEWALEDLNKDLRESEKITVPFAPESLLSGIARRMGKAPHILYKKSFSLPSAFFGDKAFKKRVILHFGAVDQIAKVTLNGKYLGEHIGGYEHFSFDVTDALHFDCENELSVEVTNAENPLSLPYGKQCESRGGMWYTPVTGIWQTVWLECVPDAYITSVSAIYKDGEVKILVESSSEDKGCEVTLFSNGETLLQSTADGEASFKLENPRLWSLEDPYLYKFSVTLGEDKIDSYFSARSFSIEEVNSQKTFCLNGKPLFLHGVLDQGYYSDGIFTPAAPECYEKDILLMKELGFNMLRKHIKIEPDIFYYYCDIHGMTVVQDMVNNGDYSFFRDTALPTVGFKRKNDKNAHRDEATRENFVSGMISTLDALYSYGSIVGWTLFNEGWGQFCSDELYELLKKMDGTRFVDSTSGWFYGKYNDVESLHVYFKPIKLKKRKGLSETQEKPIFLSEFGGYSYRIEGHIFNPEREYGYKSFNNEKDFCDALEKLYFDEVIPAVSEGVCGLVYTQLSDVEDETNGFITYDRRKLKVDAALMKGISEALFAEFEKQFI